MTGIKMSVRSIKIKVCSYFVPLSLKSMKKSRLTFGIRIGEKFGEDFPHH
jgi:hypothetical protein